MDFAYSLILLAALSGTFAGKALHPLSDEYIANINAKQSTWTAGRNFEVKDWDLFKILSSGLKAETKETDLKVTILENPHKKLKAIPTSFDARTAWPNCADIIGKIRDQSRCEAGWAFAASEVMSDRICIKSNGTKKVLVSAQDLLACSNAGTCGGSYGAVYSWSYWINYGIVTGGLYNSTNEGCKSYFLPPCDDHLNQCRNSTATPKCVQSCDSASLVYSQQKTYGATPVNRLYTEEQIQLELIANGPVQTYFYVFADFANYKSGIYKSTSEDLIGQHPVKIIGWGVENGVKYWLVANSWNERWGEKGYFRIIRGANEGLIDGNGIAGLPDLTKF